jgi:hypothetical protein
VKTLYALASVAISAAIIAIVYRLAGQIADIDDAMERDLHDTFPPHCPNPAAESNSEPSVTSARR